MKTYSLIAVAALSLLNAGTASAESPWGTDLTLMHDRGMSTMSREVVRAELSAARVGGRVVYSGEIATPPSALLAIAAYGRALTMAAASQPEVTVDSVTQWTSAEVMVDKTPVEVMPASVEAAAPAGTDPQGATVSRLLLAEPDAREESVIVGNVEQDLN